MRPLLVALLSLAFACSAGVSSTPIGNTNADCAPGSPCVCEGIGNCSRNCTGAGCAFDCRVLGNCTFACPKGGCTVVTSGQGNTTLSCAGNGCSISCASTGSCTLNECTM